MGKWWFLNHLLPGIHRVLWTQHTPKLVPQIKGFRVQHTLNRFYMDICGICANIVHIVSGLHLGMCSNLVRPCHAMPGKELWTLAVWGTLAWWTLEGDARWFRTLLHWSCFVWENDTFVGKLMQVYVSPHPLLAMGAIWKILAGHSSGSGPHPQSLGSMPCRRKAHHGGGLSMGFVGDGMNWWLGFIGLWDQFAVTLW
jgi:hypothetical protein